SQKRRTCWGRSSSSATSLMVRNASGALLSKAGHSFRVDPKLGYAAEIGLRLLLSAAVVNALFEDRRRLEHHDTPRRNWYFLTGLCITTDSLAFLSYYK